MPDARAAQAQGRAATARLCDALPEQMLNSTYAVVLAGGRGMRLKQLTQWRAKPALPFGGKPKIIDFTLSNCVNSGLRHIAVLTQYKSQGLIRHVTHAWAFLDAGRGEFIDVVPAQQQTGEGWYTGTANAVFQNLGMLQAANAQVVLILAGDHIYKMDYGCVISEHLRRAADVTVACIEVPLEQASSFGVVQVDADHRVRGFAEKPSHPQALAHRSGFALASMGVYVFNAERLYAELRRDAGDPGSSHDFGCDILPRMVTSARVLDRKSVV